MPFPGFIATFPLVLLALLFHGAACVHMPYETDGLLTEVMVTSDTNHLTSYPSLSATSYPQNAPPAQQQLPTHPIFVDVQQLRPQTQEIPGLKGMKRMVMGAALMIMAFLYFSLYTYPILMPTHHKFYQKVVHFGGELMGQPQQSRLEYTFDRYKEYVNEYPVMAAAELAVFLTGFVFFFNGLFTLGRPRKIKYIPVPQEMQ